MAPGFSPSNDEVNDGSVTLQAPFQVAEQEGYGLDPLFILQIFQALFPDLLHRDAFHALVLRLEVHLLQLRVGKLQEVLQSAVSVVHESP